MEEQQKREQKAAKRLFRKRRSAAIKRNIKRYGVEKAMYIAAIITKKLKGKYIYTPKDGKKKEKYSNSRETTAE